MPITNTHSGTRIDEIAAGVFRLSTPTEVMPGGFTFNQYLLVDEAPLLFHTGPRAIFALTREAIAAVIPPESLRYIGLSHYEADECGALNEFLALAPGAEPVCSRIAGMTSIGDIADRPPHVLGDGERLDLGSRSVEWIDTPHLPHGWECGYLFEPGQGMLFCGDLFTQPGAQHNPLTTEDVLGPSEGLRAHLEYYAHGRDTRMLLEKLASRQPRILGCMHGAAWEGDGGALLRALADRLEGRS